MWVIVLILEAPSPCLPFEFSPIHPWFRHVGGPFPVNRFLSHRFLCFEVFRSYGTYPVFWSLSEERPWPGFFQGGLWMYTALVSMGLLSVTRTYCVYCVHHTRSWPDKWFIFGFKDYFVDWISIQSVSLSTSFEISVCFSHFVCVLFC